MDFSRCPLCKDNIYYEDEIAQLNGQEYHKLCLDSFQEQNNFEPSFDHGTNSPENYDDSINYHENSEVAQEEQEEEEKTYQPYRNSVGQYDEPRIGWHPDEERRQFGQVEKLNVEKCPQCGELITSGSEKVVLGGKEYHSECFQAKNQPSVARRIRIEEQNSESCPSCHEVIISEEQIIVAGKAWHKACYNVSQEPARKYGDILRANLETCPACKENIEDAFDKIVVAGKEWHKECYKKKKEPRRNFGDILRGNVETCPGCHKEIEITGDDEKIVIGGKEWHKKCYRKNSRQVGFLQQGGIEKKNMEICPGCNLAIDPSDSERIVIGGKEWHKACQKSRTNSTSRAFGEVHKLNIEICPGCEEPIDETKEKIIIAGKEWHKSCYQSYKPGRFQSKSRKFGQLAQSNIEFCPQCNKEISVDEEKLVVAGKEWHKSCYWRRGKK